MKEKNLKIKDGELAICNPLAVRMFMFLSGDTKDIIECPVWRSSIRDAA
jgi:hypothetical protein